MNYWNKNKAELIQELLFLKAENERLTSSTKVTFDETENIRESELRYERFFENNHSVMLLIKPETGEIRDANPAACEYYGWSKSDICSKNISEINTLSAEEIFAEMHKAAYERRSYFQFKHRLANGVEKEVEVYSGPINYGNDALLYSIVHDISERKQAENALIQSEEKYSKAFLTATYGVIISRVEDGKLIEVNDAFCSITGFSREEALESTSQSLGLWFDKTDRNKVVDTLKESGRFSEMELNFRKKNGEVIIGAMSSSIVNINNEKCIFSSINDITKRKQAEEKLKISEEKYRNIFETVQDAYYEASPDGILLDISPSIETISKGQYTRNELIGKSLVGMYSDPLARGKLFTQLISQGKVIDYEMLFHNKDGSVVSIAISSTLLKDEAGNPVSITGSMRDISERKQVEIALLASEEKYRNMIQSQSEGIGLVDENEVFGYVNPGAIRIFESPNLTGMSLYDFLSPSEIEKINQQTKNRKNRISNNYELQIITPKGNVKHLSVSTEPKFDINGKYEGAYGVFMDITERKLAQNALIQSEEKYRKDLLLLYSIFESPVNIIVFSIDSEYCYSAFTKYHALTMKQICGVDIEVGMNMLELISNSDDREKAKKNFDRTLNGENFILTEEYGDDALFRTFFENFYSPVKNSTGEIIGVSVFVIDVTERMQASKNLEQSEKRFSEVVAQSQEVVWEVDSTGLYTFVSPVAKEIWGYSPEEVVGKLHFYDICPETDRDQIKKTAFGIFEKKENISNLINKIQKPDSSLVIVSSNGIPMLDECTNLIGYRGMDTDITERVNAEKALSEKSSILTNLIINLKEGILLENAVRKIELTNQLFCDMFGIPAPPDAMIGSDCTESAEQSKGLFKNSDKFVADINKILANRKPVFNDELELADGRYFERDYIPTYLNETYSGHLWKYRDITEKKLAEIELKKISQAVQQSPVMTVITDLAGNIEYINPAFTKVTGYSRDDLYGQNPRILSSGEKTKEDYALLWETISSGAEWQGEFHNKKKNGELYWVGALISAIFDSNGKITHYVSVEEDITHRKQIEKELLELNSNLEYKITERTHLLNEANQKLENDIKERILIESALRWNQSLLQLMSGSSPLAFLVVDNRTDDILYFNQRFCQIWEIEQFAEQMEHGEMKNNDIIPYCLAVLADVPAFAESCKPLQLEDNRVVVEDEIAFTNNRTVRRFSTQIRGENDEYYGRFYIFEDITERKQSEIALFESEQKCKSVVENINEVIFQTDAEGLWLYLNSAWEKVTGFTVDESIGKLFLDYVHPEDRQGNTELFEPLILRKKQYCRHEVRYLTRDGGFRWIEVYARLGLNDNDEIIGTYGTLQDITERKRAEDFENEMLQLSPQLTGISASEISTALNMALSRIGKFLNADRAYIFEFDSRNDCMSNTYEWCNTDINAEIENLQDIPCGILPMWMEELTLRRNIIIPSVTDLPLSWQAEREILEPQGIQSLIVIPMLIEDQLIGFVGLDSVAIKRDYSIAEINILKVWSSMLASLINNHRTDGLLEQTRQNFEIFFNTIDDFLWVLDIEGNIIHVNNTVIDRLGYSVSELETNSVLVAHPVDRREEAGRIVGEMLQGISEFCPVPLVTKSGLQIPVETRVKFGHWNSQPVIFGVSKDMSKIQLSEEKFSKAFHSNSASMAISSYEDGIFIDVNDTYVSTMGYSRDELIGKTSIEFNFSNSAVRDNIYDEIKNNKNIRDIEFIVTKKTGEKIMGLFSAEQIYVGNQNCLLTLFVDITERKKAEEESRNARMEAEKANQAKSEFLSRMSHELRTPMNSILGFAQLLEMGELNASQKRGVNHIMQSGKLLLDLINEVLDLSRIEAGRLSLSIEPVQLKSLYDEMLDILNPLARKYQIELRLVDSDINKLFVSADRQSLKQVVLNLLSNAIKYNKEAGIVEIKTEVIAGQKNDKTLIRISITDTGVGLSKEDIPKLFMPFERLNAYNTQIEGTGLGLSVVKKLIDAMGGTCGVESVLGKGSTFWFELYQTDSLINKLNELELNEVITPDIIQKIGTILYIEDNLSNIELIEQILLTNRPHVKLVTSTTGKEIVKIAEESKPELILLDLNLPDINGAEILKLLINNNKTKDIPVVIVSADAMQKQIEKLIKAGAKKYITKPLDIAVFLKTIDEFVKY